MKYALILISFLLSQSITNAQTGCEPNVDFEQGNLNNWILYTGNCCPISVTTSGAIAGRHSITTGAVVDPYGGFPIVDPLNGIYSLKLGNNINGREAEAARYYLHVPTGSNNYSLIFRYAVVFEDPNHDPSDQPRFEVKAFDSTTGAPISCAQYTYVASASLPGFKQSGISPNPIYKDWTSASVDLSAMNGKTIAIEFATGDCALGAHFGYAYVDVNCGLFQTYGVDCLNGNLTSLSGPPGYQAYKWWNSTFTQFYGNGQSIQIATPATTTTFAVVVTPYPGFGCVDTLYTTRRGADVTVNAGNDTTICTTDGAKTVQLKAIGKSSISTPTYTWTPTTGLSCITCSNPQATVNNTTTYVVTVTDSSKCTRADTVTVVSAPSVFTKLSSEKDSVCENEEVWVKNLLSNPVGTHFFWNNDTAKITDIDTVRGYVKLKWSGVGMKKVVLNVVNSECAISDSLYIYVKPRPIASFDLKRHGCVGQPLVLTPYKENSFYYWSLQEQTITDTIYNPKYQLIWNSTGFKKLSLSLIGHNGCASNKFESNVIIHDNPNAKIIKDSDEKICIGDLITLKTENKGSSFNYDWQPSAYFENNSYYEVVYQIQKTSMVRLNVSDLYGCIGSDSTFISADLCCRVILPDAFTPNGDGRNDIYRCINLENHKIHTFVIKNRWGQTVFETTNGQEGWNGLFNGKPQESGSYIYYIKYICQDKEIIEKKGIFHLIR